MRISAIFLGWALLALLALLPVDADAFDLQQSFNELQPQVDDAARPDNRVAQNSGGKSLSEAVDQVRRQTKGKILSAETKVSGNREVHHVKVLTDDGKVRTHKVQGRNRGG